VQRQIKLYCIDQNGSSAIHAPPTIPQTSTLPMAPNDDNWNWPTAALVAAVADMVATLLSHWLYCHTDPVVGITVGTVFGKVGVNVAWTAVGFPLTSVVV
jgi:hypothetical protein